MLRPFLPRSYFVAVLGQVPTWVELVCVTLVVAGVALRREPSS